MANWLKLEIIEVSLINLGYQQSVKANLRIKNSGYPETDMKQDLIQNLQLLHRDMPQNQHSHTI